MPSNRSVFPRLRELCEKRGFKFQAVDLRWGVRDEAGLDQQTVRICLDEVTRRQRLSPRPNFILLLGDRYGWRPPPSVIRSDEMKRDPRPAQNWRNRAAAMRPPSLARLAEGFEHALARVPPRLAPVFKAA